MTIHISLDLETWGTTPGSDIRSIGACVFSTDTGLVHDGSLGTIRPFYTACDNPVDENGTHAGDYYRKYPLRRDPSTIKWWSEQSAEAQGAFHAVSCSACDGWGKLPNYADLSEDSGFVDCYECDGRGKTGTDPVDLKEALQRFTYWLISLSADHNQPVVTYLAMANDDRVKLDDIRIWSHGAAFDPPILAAAYEAVGLPVPWHYRAPRDTRTAFDMAGIDDHSAWLAQHAGDDRVQHHALSDAICQARAVCAAWVRRPWNAVGDDRVRPGHRA